MNLHKKGVAAFIISGIAGIAAITQASFALPPAVNCPGQHSDQGALSAHRLPTSQGECLLEVSPESDGLNYRSFTFSSSGLFQIFNSFEPLHAQPVSGARAFFIFPRKRLPDFHFSEANQQLTVTLSDQSKLTFSTATGRAVQWDHMFTESLDVNRTNQGGFEINGPRTLILDTGWAFRKPAYAIASGKSEFRDAFGNRCALLNRELFIYDGSAAYDPKFRFAKDSELKNFLAERCPQLSFE